MAFLQRPKASTFMPLLWTHHTRLTHDGVDIPLWHSTFTRSPSSTSSGAPSSPLALPRVGVGPHRSLCEVSTCAVIVIVLANVGKIPVYRGNDLDERDIRSSRTHQDAVALARTRTFLCFTDALDRSVEPHAITVAGLGVCDKHRRIGMARVSSRKPRLTLSHQVSVRTIV